MNRSTLTRSGGYDPRLGRDHPSNRDETLEGAGMSAREEVGTALDAVMRSAGYRLVRLGSPPVNNGRVTTSSTWERDGREITVSIEEPVR